MKTSLTLADRRFNINRKAILSLIGKILKGESASENFMDIVYCSDSKMIKLNCEFKNKNRTTDVLAFNLDDDNNPNYLGEIYINLQQAKRQAIEHNQPYLKELKRLTVHGVLHLLGYTDEINSSKVKMWARQEGYL